MVRITVIEDDSQNIAAILQAIESNLKDEVEMTYIFFADCRKSYESALFAKDIDRLSFSTKIIHCKNAKEIQDNLKKINFENNIILLDLDLTNMQNNYYVDKDDELVKILKALLISGKNIISIYSTSRISQTFIKRFEGSENIFSAIESLLGSLEKKTKSAKNILDQCIGRRNNIIKKLPSVDVDHPIPEIQWNDFLKKIYDKIKAKKAHDSCDKPIQVDEEIPNYLYKFLGLTMDDFRQFFCSNDSMNNFARETMKGMVNSRDRIPLSVGWLLAFGIYRNLFNNVDYRKHWKIEKLKSYGSDDIKPLFGVELYDGKNKDRVYRTLRIFCKLCEKIFRQDRDDEDSGLQIGDCILNNVNFIDTVNNNGERILKAITFCIDLDFEKLHATLVKFLGENENDEHDVSMLIREYWTFTSLSVNKDNDFFSLSNTYFCIRKSSNNIGMEVTFGDIK